ncbi:MAG: cell division protein FtsA [Candidatus Niyogibacteria bacterium CG10_big_fil_rev_8_21_14_0_10_46_36]|uniref:Cell division protein FtsA n=1 Tax=Candidatus Niyogibacteria bacterium CG10_big_fil_rev_8_21_14_0_10_46_36 TaxID=1974726 RepID=A0A2H0TE24_9BACT|nr:MAG: cell division protein FtsA [Candidatus Niyogibacteria bacterium CG10_big_fil_rev_8_21_14_0_10_46_36]
MARHIATGIDIGVSSIQTMITEWDDASGRMQIRGVGDVHSEGVRRGDIIDIDAAATQLKKSLFQATKMAGTKVSSAFFSYGGASLDSSIARGSLVLPYANGGDITERDVSRVLDASYASIVPHHNKEILHRFPILFRVDKDLITRNPVGITGSRLEAETLFVTALSQQIEHIAACAERVGIAVDDVVASPLAASRAVLSQHKKEVGVMTLDIGAGTVSAAIFEEGVPVSVKTFPIGAQAITHDIAIGLRIGLEEAERQKQEYRNFRGSTKKHIEEIITARAGDIFESVDAHLKKINRDGLLPGGVILAGGGSHLFNIEAMGRDSLKLPVEVARALEESELAEEFDPRFATVAGLCLMAYESDIESGGGMFSGFSQKGGSLLWRWFKAFLP